MAEQLQSDPKDYSEQLNRVADRVERVAASGTVAERQKAAQSQAQQAGRLLMEAIRRGWVGVRGRFRQWAEETVAGKPAAPGQPHLLDPHVRVFSAYVDIYHLHGKDPLVCSEAGGLSAYTTISKSADEVAATLGNRLIVVADACRAISREIPTPVSQRLVVAVDGVLHALSEWRNFDELAKARVKQSQSDTHLRNALAQVNRTAAIERAELPPREALSDGFVAHLRGVAETGELQCELAALAIALGGAVPLDEALNPGSRNKSVTLDVKIQAAQVLFGKAQMELVNPPAVMGPSVAAMKALWEWFREAKRESRRLFNEPHELPTQPRRPPHHTQSGRTSRLQLRRWMTPTG